jgi:hypothetical protein
MTNINHQLTDTLTIAIELNIIAQRCNEERKRNHFIKYMDLIIKESLRIQEYVLLNPTKEPPIKTVTHWLNNLLKIDEELAKSAIGLLLREFLRKHTSDDDN